MSYNYIKDLLTSVTRSTRDGSGKSQTYTSTTPAQATYTLLQYTVAFVADDTTVKTMTVDHGYVLTDEDYPEVPEKEGYSGAWSPCTGPITADVTIDAIYTLWQYTVTFVADGATVKTMAAEHGYILTGEDYPAVPEKEGYRGAWNRYIGPITSDVTVNATYTLLQFTVTFVADGVTVKTMTVDYGYVLTEEDYPAFPKKEGYHGAWTQYTNPVTSNVTIQAAYHEPYSCTVRFFLAGKFFRSITVEDEYVLTEADYPDIPEREGYRGDWEKYTAPITSDIIIQGHYSEAIPVPTLPPDLEIMSVEEESPSAGDEAPTAANTDSSGRELVSSETERHRYLYANGKLLRETVTGGNGSKTLDFLYDNNGTPYALRYSIGSGSPVTYYYITNLQGDVTALIDSSKKVVAAYEYDPYGKILTVQGLVNGSLKDVSNDPNHVANANPLRYRGYYYDSETGFYYLQSRYYDPAVCRFINADQYASTGYGFTGYNMFAYCGNDPINYLDATGSKKARAADLIAADLTKRTHEEYVASDNGKYVIHVESGKVWRIRNTGNLNPITSESTESCYAKACEEYGEDMLGGDLEMATMRIDSVLGYQYHASPGVIMYQVVAYDALTSMDIFSSTPTLTFDLGPAFSFPAKQTYGALNGKNYQLQFY